MTQPAVYYVAYTSESGLGGIEVNRPQPISSMDDVQDTRRVIAQTHGSDVVIISYQLINQPTPADTATIAGLVDHAQRALTAGATPKTILTGLLTELNKISR